MNRGFTKTIPTAVSESILDAIRSGDTSLMDNPAVPVVGGESILVRLVAEKVGKLGDCSDVAGMHNRLSGLITECMERERDNRPALESLCADVVLDILQVPDDMLTLDVKLTENIDDSSQRLLPESDDEYEYDSLSDMSDMENEIARRRMMNAIVTGASVVLSSNVKSYVQNVFDIDPYLPSLYKEIMELNEKLLYLDGDVSDDDGSTKGAVVDVSLGSPDKTVVVKAQGVIFPMLLSETIKGVLEIASAHGLPDDMRRAEHIMKCADYSSSEVWDMRLGTIIWERIYGQTPGVDPSYLILALAEMGTAEFTSAVKEMIACTREGKRIADSICEDIRYELEQDDFDAHMHDMADKYRVDDSEDPDDDMLRGW